MNTKDRKEGMMKGRGREEDIKKGEQEYPECLAHVYEQNLLIREIKASQDIASEGAPSL